MSEGGSLVSALTPHSADVTIQRFNASTRQGGKVQTSFGNVESEDQTPFAAFLAGLPHGFGGFCDARIISIAGLWEPVR